MMRCKYYDVKTINGDGCTSKCGRCLGMKDAPIVSCNGDELECEIVKIKTAYNSNSNYYNLVSEIVFQVKITERTNTVEKVYCKSREDVNSFINTILSKRDLTKIQNIQITPIKNLYYRKR